MDVPAHGQCVVGGYNDHELGGDLVSRLPANPPVLAGFTYLRPLGSGGFADVFLYEQNLPRRQVAVKVLPTEVSDPEVRRMFHAEADALARLSAHPSIVTIHQASVSADGRPYIVMELCPTSMGQRYRTEQLVLPEVLNTGVKMACALETAHRAGVLHRDVKPSNILITEYGTPVLSDFGIAASLRVANPREVFAMSVPWSAPEVLSTSTVGSISSEVWALGATVYSLLAGRSPFELANGQNGLEQIKQRIVRAAHQPTGRWDVPAQLEGVLARSMSLVPRDRHASAADFARDLQQIQRLNGLPETPLELAAAGWSSAPADFDADSDFGVTRVKVPHTSERKKAAAVNLSSRSAESDTTSLSHTPPARRSAWPWVVAGLVGTVTIGVVVWLLAGVL